MSRQTRKSIDRGITRQLASMIVAVNEDESIDAIKYLVEKCSRPTHATLDLLQVTAPNVDLTQQFECGECGREQDMEVPLNADFFGLTDEYMESVYEQFFFLKYSGGWSFSEAYNLPIFARGLPNV